MYAECMNVCNIWYMSVYHCAILYVYLMYLCVCMLHHGFGTFFTSDFLNGCTCAISAWEVPGQRRGWNAGGLPTCHASAAWSHPSEEPWSHGTEALLPTPLRPWGVVLVAAKSKCHDFRRSGSRCFFLGQTQFSGWWFGNVWNIFYFPIYWG